jgi:leucine-rich melanocyte differentiation-associated protein
VSQHNSPQVEKSQMEDGGEGEEDESPEEPSDDQEAGFPERGKVSFGVSRYVYYGKQSEGNRFILNQDL